MSVWRCRSAFRDLVVIPCCLLQAPKATQVVPGVVQGPLAAQVGGLP